MHRLTRLSVRALRGSFLMVAAAAACLALVGGSTAAASGGEGESPVGETSFDGAGAVFVRRGDTTPAELAIQNFSSSGLIVRWASNAIPVTFCTIQANRPSTVTAEQFRDSVRAAAEMWNNIEAAVGVRYGGDCLASRVEFDDNLNEIGWDDARNLVSGSQAGLTQGSWFTTLGRRDFIEADVVLDSRLRVPDVCLRTVVAHEMGHAIGFGHSDSRADLMYPSFTSSDLSTCRPTASDDEARWLVNLYGPNRRPTVTSPGDRTVPVGAPVTLSVQASDPEGDAMTFEWRQTGGTPTTLSGSGNTVSLTAPASGTVTLEVAVFDRYLHRSAASLTLTTTTQAAAAVPAPPSLQSITANATRTASTLKWSLVDEAQSHEFCVTVHAATTCTGQTTPSAEVAWATGLSSGGRPDERTVLALDMRTTGMRACNTRGCSAAGMGPQMGGFRWTNWGVSYDVIAMALDVSGAGLRFTIGGAVNVGDSPRRFMVYTGPEDDPQRTMVRDCGVLDPGQSCIGFMGSSDNGHGELVVIESSAPGTPEAVHRVRVR